MLKNEIMELTNTFPSDEKFRLTDQLVRASRSINANIAEGHGRFTYKDQLHFCIQARGSSETLKHITDALDCGYISQDQSEKFRIKIEEIRRLLNGYISFLRKNVSGPVNL